MELYENKTRFKLLKIREDLKGVNSLKRMKEILVEDIGNISSGDLKRFTHKINNHLWHGYIYTKHNSLMGSVFSYYGNKQLIIRGYPKIKYTDSEKILCSGVYAEDKLDGTNLNIFSFPDGNLMGKTRLSTRWDVAGYEGRVYRDLFDRVGITDKVNKLTKEDYQVFGELYGYDNPGEFIQYSFPIAFSVLDICDMKTLGFVDRKTKEELCWDYDLPLVNVMWSGSLSEKEVERLKFECKKNLTIDGIEGLVAKLYDSSIKDVTMAKIKCKEIQEKCWKISGGKIPKVFIYKAIQKAKENIILFKNKDQLREFVIEELKEEFDTDMIRRSKSRIDLSIKDKFTYSDMDSTIIEYLNTLKDKGIDITNRGVVMANLANKFIGYDANKLYILYKSFKDSM